VFLRDLEFVEKQKLTVDLTGLKDDIESCRHEIWWQELSLNGKIRSLLRERVDQLQKEKQALPYPNFKCLLLANLDRLSTNSKVEPRLQDLLSGVSPTEAELLRIALELNLNEDVLDRLLKEGVNHEAVRDRSPGVGS
jgi:hypothetical protein